MSDETPSSRRDEYARDTELGLEVSGVFWSETVSGKRIIW